MTATNTLDADELLHLAIDASQKAQNDKSIEYLKQAIKIKPENGKIHYMLGAMHAEIGMYERAIEDMQKAVEADPMLDTAHFQLGLLYITSGNVEEAEKAWSPLDRLGKSNPLYIFKTGILQLTKDEFQECIDTLEKGIKLNTQNLPLNKDMQMLIEKAKAALSGNNNDDNTGKPDESGSHVYLNAYNDDEQS